MDARFPHAFRDPKRRTEIETEQGGQRGISPPPDPIPEARPRGSNESACILKPVALDMEARGPEVRWREESEGVGRPTNCDSCDRARGRAHVLVVVADAWPRPRGLLTRLIVSM